MQVGIDLEGELSEQFALGKRRGISRRGAQRLGVEITAWLAVHFWLTRRPKDPKFLIIEPIAIQESLYPQR